MDKGREKHRLENVIVLINMVISDARESKNSGGDGTEDVIIQKLDSSIAYIQDAINELNEA